MEIPPEQLEICMDVLQRLADDPAVISGHERMKALISKIHREGRKGARREERKQMRAKDLERQHNTAIVQAQREQQSATPYLPTDSSALPLHCSLRCYICKGRYTELHSFYHLLCPRCAGMNYAKRFQRTNLTDRIALITGGRIKIGFHTALKLLRDGAKVLVTTRFPRECALRYAAEPDFAEWSHRLRIFGLDLRNVPAVEVFLRRIQIEEPYLDILINNAAQTIRRPPAFYAPQLALETHLRDELPLAARALICAEAPLIFASPEEAFRLPIGSTQIVCRDNPPMRLDADGQSFDLRPTNSWSLRLHEVGTVEALEVLLINTVASLLMTARLKETMLRSPFSRRFIINVSAMEGQFARESKTPFHPHTNMAKAALNMLTRTSAQDYARGSIYMNSVDTGWITDENPHPKRERLREDNGFYTPLDAIDGAARLYDPIATGINETAEPVHGQFLKDYMPHAW